MFIEVISVQAGMEHTEGPVSLEDILSSAISGSKGGPISDEAYSPITIKIDTIDKFCPSDIKPNEYTDIFTADGDIILAAITYTEFKERLAKDTNPGWSVTKSKNTDKIEIKWQSQN